MESVLGRTIREKYNEGISIGRNEAEKKYATQLRAANEEITRLKAMLR